MIAIAISLSAAGVIFAFLWFTRTIWFHRDPDHGTIDQDIHLVKSPVYGIVSYIKKIEQGKITCQKKGESIEITEITKDNWPAEYPDGTGWIIGIAMTALDVHFQYAPSMGEIESIRHRPASVNLPMFDIWEYIKITWLRKGIQLFARKYVLENERQTMWIKNELAKVGLVLIADKFVNKISTFVSEGQHVMAGEKLSFIGRGSQVDLIICGQNNIEILVEEGQAVKGPLTLLAKLKP